MRNRAEFVLTTDWFAADWPIARGHMSEPVHPTV
jgi:hypothetical protein